MDNKNLRSIPLSKQFLNPKVDDLLYGILLKESNFHNGNRYISMINYNKVRPFIKDTLELSQKAYQGHFSKMLELDLIQFIESFTPESYVFPAFKPGDIYQLIPVKIMDKIIANKIPHGIKLYALLLNKFLYFKDQYNFSFIQLAQELGWAKTNKDAAKVVHESMDTLREIGVINWEEQIWINPANNMPLKKHRLTFVENPHEAYSLEGILNFT